MVRRYTRVQTTSCARQAPATLADAPMCCDASSLRRCAASAKRTGRNLEFASCHLIVENLCYTKDLTMAAQASVT